MAETSLDRRFGQIHQRVDAHDQRIKGLEIESASNAVSTRHIDQKLTKIEDGIAWITRLVIAGLIGGIVGFIIQGGLNVLP